MDAQQIAAQAVAEATEALDCELVRPFAEALLAVAASPRRLSTGVIDGCEAIGRRAALDGVSLPGLVDGFLSVSRIVWVHSVQSPPTNRAATPQRLVATGEAIFRATDTALAAVARGFGAARRALVRQQESERRELIDDLLLGSIDTAAVVSRAERFGLHMTAPHTVVVAAVHDGFRDDPSVVAELEARLRSLLPQRDLLVATKEGRLVLVIGERGGPEETLAENERLLRALLQAVRRRLDGEATVRLSVGPALQGPTGISESYRAARRGADIAHTLGWAEPIVRPPRLAVYDVLLRDRHALTMLVRSVLAPLETARGGAAPLVETLSMYLACGGVATETARRMHLSVRAVTYRLGRIKALTGWDPVDPAHWLTLHAAAEGARLLGWPEESG